VSERQIIATLRAALADAAFGLADAAADVIALEGIAAGIVTTDYNFIRWKNVGSPAVTSAGHEVAVVPARSAENLEIPAETQRDGLIDIELTFTTFHSDAGAIEDNVLVHAAALRRCLDRLREFSDANGGTVLQVREPVTIDFLTTTGNATSAGFRARFTIEERSQV
jgi:hypothetical protein